MELTRGRVLPPPVMDSVEAPYDMKESKTTGSRGGAPLEKFFDHAL